MKILKDCESLEVKKLFVRCDVLMSMYLDWKLSYSGPGQQGAFYQEDLYDACCNEADK